MNNSLCLHKVRIYCFHSSACALYLSILYSISQARLLRGPYWAGVGMDFKVVHVGKARDAMRNALVDSYIANLRMDRFHQLVITRRTSAGVVSFSILRKWAHKTEIRQELRHIKEAEKS